MNGKHSPSATKLFNEALSTYIQAMSRHHLLTANDKHLLLIAIHGLVTLDDHPLARALIRVCFSHMTADDYDECLRAARNESHGLDLTIPF